jgi:hypothetical protein
MARTARGAAAALAVALLVSVSTGGPVHAQDAPAGGQDLQAAAQNPIADLISVPIQGNVFTGVGPDDDPSYLINLQPVVPLSFGDRWNVILRPIIPVVAKPVLFPGGDSEAGLGDLTLQAFLSPQQTVPTAIGELSWGAGPILSFPTRTDTTLGTRDYTAGPAVVVFFAKRPWTYGFLAFNQWSIAGPEGEPDVNQLTVQPFINFNLPEGWSLGTSPIITVDWTEDEDNVALPVGGGVSKLMRFGKQPVKLSANAYYYALRPEGGPEWQGQLQFTLLFPR